MDTTKLYILKLKEKKNNKRVREKKNRYEKEKPMKK